MSPAPEPKKAAVTQADLDALKTQLANDLEKRNRARARVTKTLDGKVKANLEAIKQQRTLTRFIAAPVTPGDENRLTLIVPYDGTVLNLGQASKVPVAGSGLFVGTDHRVHLETRKDEAATSVTLGQPASAATMCDFWNVSPKDSKGYMMITKGNAWTSAWGAMKLNAVDDLCLRSAKGPVRLQVEKGPLQQTATTVGIDADEHVVIRAGMGANAERDIISLMAPTRNDVATVASNGVTKTLMKLSDWGVTTLGFLLKARTTDAVPVWSACKFNDELNKSTAKMLVDVGKLASSMARASDKEFAPGKVDITAKSYASLTGKIATSIWGGVSAGLYSPVSASVMGGTASLKGLAWASVWAGIEASLKAFKDVSISGDRGKVKISGHQDVTMASRTGRTMVSGKTGLQLTSDNLVLGHGGQMATLTSGSSDKFGVVCTPQTAAIGYLQGSTDTELEKVAWGENDGCGLVASKQGTKLRAGSKTKLSLKQDGTVSLDMKKFVCNGKVLLG